MPATPPNRAPIEYLRKIIASNPETRAAMEQVLRRSAVAQAQCLGNLRPGAEDVKGHATIETDVA